MDGHLDSARSKIRTRAHPGRSEPPHRASRLHQSSETAESTMGTSGERRVACERRRTSRKFARDGLFWQGLVSFGKAWPGAGDDVTDVSYKDLPLLEGG